MRLIKKGAEAELYLADFEEFFMDFGEDEKIIIKSRVPKKYRIKEIDNRLRNQRTIGEARIIHKVKKTGVKSPHIYEVNLDQYEILMEYIDGITMKEYLSNTQDVKICKRIGRLVGKIHNADIIHGDLTTSNMIKKDDEIYFIDFGLSKFSTSVEDQGVDLHLLRQALESAHYDMFEKGFENLINGYNRVTGNGEQLKKKVKEIESRGRYK